MSIPGTGIISYIKNLKHFCIVFSADLDSAIASSMLLRIAREEDVETYLAPFYSASKPLSADTPVMLVKVLQRGPVGGVKLLQLDDILGRDPRVISSITMYLLRELKKNIVVPRYLEVLSLVAMISIGRGYIHDDNIIEVHKELLNEAIDKNIYTIADTLRLFGYPERDIIEALTRTIDPYILGISLNPSESRKILESLGMPITSDEGRAKLVEILNARLSAYCRSRPPIAGPKIVIKDKGPIDDVYEATYMLYSYADVLGLESLLYVCLDSRVIELVKGVYHYVSQSLKSVLDQTIEEGGAKKVIVRGIRVGIVDISSAQPPLPLYTIHKILRTLGLTEDITAFTNGKEYLLPLPFTAPRWPYDKELNIERGYVVFNSLQDLVEVLK